MYIYLYIYIYLNKHCQYILIHTLMCVYNVFNIYTYIHIYVYIYIYIYIYVCIYIYTCLCIYVYIYVYIYMYIYVCVCVRARMYRVYPRRRDLGRTQGREVCLPLYHPMIYRYVYMYICVGLTRTRRKTISCRGQTITRIPPTLLYQGRLPRLCLHHRPARRPSERWRERVRVNPLPLTLNP